MLFVSYSHKDRNKVEAFISKLYFLIDKKDIWIDYEQLDLALLIKPCIDIALHNMQQFIVFVSHSSVKSGWVTYEYQLAKQLLPRESIFQIILDDDLKELD